MVFVVESWAQVTRKSTAHGAQTDEAHSFVPYLILVLSIPSTCVAHCDAQNAKLYTLLSRHALRWPTCEDNLNKLVCCVRLK
jgi:hypothetical protein